MGIYRYREWDGWVQIDTQRMDGWMDGERGMDGYRCSDAP